MEATHLLIVVVSAFLAWSFVRAYKGRANDPPLTPGRSRWERELEQRKTADDERRLVENYIRSNLPALRRLRRKSHDKLGLYRPDFWESKKQVFIKDAIRHEFGRKLRMSNEELSRNIEKVMNGAGVQGSSGMTGDNYQILCVGLLRQAGWTVEETKASGDDGVDLVASAQGLRVALKCKRFPGKVGKGAVQAVVGGAVFYGATDTAVVSTGEFSPAAQDLAAFTGTLLLHHDQLRDLMRLLSTRLARRSAAGHP